MDVRYRGPKPGSAAGSSEAFLIFPRETKTIGGLASSTVPGSESVDVEEIEDREEVEGTG